MLGAAFHRGHYVIYDDENSRIGVGPAHFYVPPEDEDEEGGEDDNRM